MIRLFAITFLFFLYTYPARLFGQAEITTISNFSSSNFNAVNCSGAFNVSYGSSLCVTDLEGSCVAPCSGVSGLGA
ncbi:MAG: hypothetical protein AAF738_06130, partial [Bacteroidota bacterium]